MLDNIKLYTKDQSIIKRLAEMQDFERYQHRNNNYDGFCKYGKLMRLDFRKSFENGVSVGSHHLEISISPHYHYNQYRHNGNDFTPKNCIKTITGILTYLGIEQNEYEALKVVNIEFGLNLIPETDIKNLINGISFYKKTPFKVGDFLYFKKTNATAYKQIKAYSKGLQFAEAPQYGINLNTFRFEVKSKQAKNIKKYGITNANDLLKLETYNHLEQTLLNEWEQILLINLEPDLSHSKPDEVQFINECKNVNFWNDLITQKHRNTFKINKEKYYKILDTKNNLHHLIKLQIIDKLFSFQKCANSTQKTPINKGNSYFDKNTSKLINLESAHFSKCLVTKLDISMQKKGSKFLCISGLKYYKENEPEIYKDLEKKYLSEKMKLRDIESQIYYISHNIRNEKTNANHNPKYSRQRFEQRNYHPNQLQLF